MVILMITIITINNYSNNNNVAFLSLTLRWIFGNAVLHFKF